MKSIVTFVLIGLSLAASAQVKILSASLKNTDSAVLYRDIRNLLQINDQSDFQNYTLMADGKPLEKENNSFIAIPTNENKITIELRKHDKTVATKEFRVEMLAMPVLGIGRSANKSLTRQFILINPYVSYYSPNNQLNVIVNIAGFKCLTTSSRFGKKSFECYGARFSPELIEEIKRLEPGDKIHFDYIRIGWGPPNSSRCPRTFEGFEITII